jgi:hypothetical protein
MEQYVFKFSCDIKSAAEKVYKFHMPILVVTLGETGTYNFSFFPKFAYEIYITFQACSVYHKRN